MNIMDSKKAVTAEDLIRRYNLENLKSDRKLIQTIKENANNTNNLLNNFIDATVSDLQNLQDQVDGNIATWFFSGVPTLENLPAMDWVNDEDKNNHLGDLYYDKDTGYAYRFTLDDATYSWMKLSDSDIAEALAIANAAQDTADSKRRVFVTQPTPPYDVGDIWIKEDTDLYRCRASRNSGNFNEVDWILATDYSNDDYAKNVEAVLNQFKTEVEANYATTVQLETTAESIEASVQSITTLTNTLSQTSALIIEDGYESDLLKFSIIGNMSLLYPSSDLYPSNDLYPLDSYLIVEHEDGTQTKIHLPLTYLNYLDETTYDEFVVENGQANIIRRVGVSEGGVLYPLETEIVEYKGTIAIGIKQGYNKIWLESFYDYDLKYNARYLYQSDYTTTFAPRVEMNSVIEQTAEGINTEVSKKVGKNEIISTINQSAESVTINANKIGLTANNIIDLIANSSINLTSKNISISSNNFSVSSQGNLNCNDATMNSSTVNNSTINTATINTANINTANITDSDINDVTIDNASMTNVIVSGTIKGSVFKGTNDNSIYLKIGDDAESQSSLSTNNCFQILRPDNSNMLTLSSRYWDSGSPLKELVFEAPVRFFTFYSNFSDYRVNSYAFVADGFMYSPAYNGGSLESIKKNIELFKDNALNIIGNSDLYTYNLKTENNEDKKHIGLIIGDDEKTYKTPNCIISKDGTGVDLYSMISIAWKAIQEQQEIINQLEKRIEEIENERNSHI